MKVKQLNHKVAILTIATFALAATTLNTIQPFLSQNSTNPTNSAYAAEGRRVEVVNATGSIVVPSEFRDSLIRIDRVDLSISIPNISQYSAGDYVEIKTENLSIPISGREVRVNDTIIGKVQASENLGFWKQFGTDPSNKEFQSLEPEKLGYYSTYKVMFNERIKDLAGTAIINLDSINIFNRLGIADRDYVATQKIIVNEKTIAQHQVKIGKYQKFGRTKPFLTHGGLYSSTQDGETITMGGMNEWIHLEDGTTSRDNWLKDGDIIQVKFKDDHSGLAFDNDSQVGKKVVQKNAEGFSEANPQGMYFFDTSNSAEYEVIEASPRVMKYRVVKAPDYKHYRAVIFDQRFKLLDTSPATIDYDNQKIKPVTLEHSLVRADGSEVSRYDVRHYSDITGARLKAYAQIKKRGSIIRQIQDEKGNKILGFESDKLILEHVQEGTTYNVEAPSIPGYTFSKISTNSAPQKGTVKEGVQNVVLVYSINSQGQTVKIGENPDPKLHIPDFDKNFPGCTIKYKTTPDTSKAGVIDATLIISCPDQPDKEVDVRITITEEAQPTPEIKAPDTGVESQNIFASILAGGGILTIVGIVISKKFKM